MIPKYCNVVNGVQFEFVRRRYGRKTFTWLHYRNEDDKWQEYKGDPWPSVTIPRKDLERIAEEIKISVAPDIEMHGICEMFDVEVIQDYWLGTDDCPEAGYPMYALGQRAELAAGLRGFTMTPWFESMDKLYAFCRRNFARFREHYNQEPDGPAPDASNWS